MQTKKPGKQPNKFLVFSTIGLEMGLTIYLSIKLGKWLDIKFSGDFKTYTLICTVLGFIVSMYLLIKKLNKLNS